jgi:hypothetical protein
MLRRKKNLLWFMAVVILASALWALNVEITYERNVRHIPTNFHQRHRNAPPRWKA